MSVRSMLRRAVLVAVAAGAQAAHAESRQFGNVIYEVPQGWATGSTADNRQVLISDLPDDRCEFCYIYIGNALPGGGPIEKALDANRTMFLDEDIRAEAKVMGQPTYFSLGGHPAGLVAMLVSGDLHIFAVVALEDRVHPFGFTGDAGDEDELNDSMDSFQNAFTPMMESARFVSDGGESLLPEAIPGDLDGVWWGTETAWPLGLDGMMHMEIYHTHLMFWPDGHFYRGTPPQGTAAPDRAALMAAADTAFGVYSRKGSTLTLTYADGTTDTATIDGTGIILGGTTAYPVEMVADGERIEGTISSFSFSGFTPGSGVQGGASASSYTTFRKDGSYEGESSGGAFGNFESGGDYTGGFSTGGENKTGGTYEIRNGLIVSTPNDGSAPRSSLIFRSGDDIVIGEQFLE